VELELMQYVHHPDDSVHGLSAAGGSCADLTVFATDGSRHTKRLLGLRSQVDQARAAEGRSNQEIVALEQERTALLSDERVRKFLAINEKIAHLRLEAARARQDVLVLEPILEYAEDSQRMEAVDD